jgi:hypothetical protein
MPPSSACSAPGTYLFRTAGGDDVQRRCFVINQAHNSILTSGNVTSAISDFRPPAQPDLRPLVYLRRIRPPLGLAGIAWGTVTIRLWAVSIHAARCRPAAGHLGLAGYRPGCLSSRPVQTEFSASLTVNRRSAFCLNWYGALRQRSHGCLRNRHRIEQIVPLPVMGLNVATLTQAQNASRRPAVQSGAG